MPVTRAKLKSFASIIECFTMQPDEFKVILLEALSDDAVVRKQQEVMKTALDKIYERINDLNLRHDALKKQVEKKDIEITALHKKVDNLEQKIDDMEQWQRKGSIRIQGLSEDGRGSVDEKVLHLCNEVLQVQPPLQMADIEVAHRLPGRKVRRQAHPRRATTRPGSQAAAADADAEGSSDESGDNDGRDDGDNGEAPYPQSVIVKFASRRVKARVMEKRAKLKGVRNPCPIFIQDDLTAARAKMAFRARQLKRDGKITDTWVFDSRVLIKDSRGTIHQVKSFNDLN